MIFKIQIQIELCQDPSPESREYVNCLKNLFILMNFTDYPSYFMDPSS